MVTLSVIVPAYNAASTLGEALSCLLAQTRCDWEAIVVDDGSTDDTVDIACSFAERDPRIRLILTQRAKASGARNAGLYEAKGRWVLFLDSDDWIAPELVEKLLARLEADPGVSAAYCAFDRVTPDGQPIRHHWVPEVESDPFDRFARHCATSIHSVVTDRSLVMRLGGFDPALATCEDWDLWQRIARTGAKFVGVPEPLAFYRMGPGTLSRDGRQLAKDGLVVLRRGASEDPRVADPDPAYRYGVSASESTVALFLAWCAAVEAGAGREGATLLGMAEVPDLVDDVEGLRYAILDGLTYGAGLPIGSLSQVWKRIEPSLLSTLDRLEKASSQAYFARRLRYAVEREILRQGSGSETLSLTMSAKVDVGGLVAVQPAEGVDVVQLNVTSGSELLTRAEIPAFGTICPQDIARIAIDDLGLRHYLWRTRARHRPGFWLRYSVQAGRLLAREVIRRSDPHGVKNALGTAQTRAAVSEAGMEPRSECYGEALRRRIESIGVSLQKPRARSDAEEMTTDASTSTDGVPVLMYHRIADAGPDGLSRYRTTPGAFEEQMRWLRDHGYRTLSSWDFQLHRSVRNPVILTFDDGYRDFLENAWPILSRYGLIAEVFIVTDKVGGMSDWDRAFGESSPLMDWDEIRRLHGEGVRFGSHLATHAPADGLPSEDLVREAAGSRAALESHLEEPVHSLALPYGIVDERLNRILPACGYTIGFSTRPGVATSEDHPFTLPRIEVRGDWTIEEFARTLSTDAT